MGDAQFTNITPNTSAHACAKFDCSSSTGQQFMEGGWKPPAVLDQKSPVGLGLNKLRKQE